MRRFNLVSDLARKQAGIVSREQLIDLGFKRTAIHRALASGLLVRVFHGVYRLGSAYPSRDCKLWAALLCAGEGAVLSHVAAGFLWGLDALGLKPPPEIDVSIPHTRMVAPAPNLRVHRTNVLEPVKDFAKLHGFPCTSIARTLVDLASVLSRDDLESAFNSAVRKNRENGDAVVDALARLGLRSRRGASTLLDIATREELGVTDSRLEDRVRIAIREAGIRVPLTHLQICDSDGEQIGIFDFAWPEAMVVVVCDSWKHHGGQNMFHKDRDQGAALIAEGWFPFPVTWRHITQHCDVFIQRLRQALDHGMAAHGKERVR